jgi:hypothetical protein
VKKTAEFRPKVQKRDEYSVFFATEYSVSSESENSCFGLGYYFSWSKICKLNYKRVSFSAGPNLGVADCGIGSFGDFCGEQKDAIEKFKNRLNYLVVGHYFTFHVNGFLARNRF